jgi:transposase
MAMAIVESTRPVTGGVDTHLDTHVAAALDANGGVLGVESFPATRAGYASLSSWLAGFGPIDRVGVEGTGAYGAGLARHLRSLGVGVIEVDRPNRQLRRAQGKSDTLDAIEAARAVLSGRATGVAKTADGNVEAMRALLIAKRSGREARITCLNQIRHLGFTAPDELRERFQSVPRTALAAQAAALRPRPDRDAVLFATKLAMRSLGRRVLTIDDEIARLDATLAELVTATAPGLLGLYGVGVDTAAILCVAAGDNPQRVRSEAAWAHLCGVAPPRGNLRQGHPPPPAQPGREPPGEPCAVAHRVHPSRLRCPHPHLRRPPPRRRTVAPRDHPQPQALRRPRDLPAPPTLRICSGGPGPITA